ncbi:MAG: endopeptidase La [Armatimonadetes bacterium CG2_30_59_28]|nr:MAG: endopeptidase La [Armatimonadetes bacterium CG2_30_59_28]PIU64619.1 MAG: endopeptidase La [Armatimonadetes bacterium CG07_land_8_20_14_0_80_59_28]
MKERNSAETITISDLLPVVPVRNVVIFPYMLVPLVVNREKSINAVNAALSGDHVIGVFLQRDKDEDDPAGEGLHPCGTAAIILKMMRAPDNTVRLLCQGIVRITASSLDASGDHLSAHGVETHYDVTEEDIEIQAQGKHLLGLFQKTVALSGAIPDEVYATAMNLEDAGKLADFVASTIDLNAEQQQEVLSALQIGNRLRRLTELANHQLEILELTGKIEAETRNQMDKAQREYILRQQLHEIQKELGEEDPQAAEIHELRQKVEESQMPEDARKAADRELDRLSKMPPAAAEYTVARTYLDWLVTIPWAISTEDNLDIRKARRILDEDHYDLQDVKDRILEYLSVLKLKADTKGPILCFVGPPGVGKTSLGQSIARSLGRKFIRMSLGGVRDESEIRGHRRTYIGSLPGRIVQGIRNAGSNNPLFMLDEVDKLGSDFRGDPSSALLEVLDPAQNHTFMDHYLDIPVDLSRVMFITTANMLDTIPPALLDRMEVLRLAGYTTEERISIAQQYLIPRQMGEHGLAEDHIYISPGALRRIVLEYTREAGVRNLEREIGSLCRKTAHKVAAKMDDEGKISPEDLRTARNSINAHNLPEYLGPPRYFSEVADMEDRIGVATGLAWTPVGGTILAIETAKMKGKNGLTLTGQLGEVMQESAKTAMSYLRSHQRELNIPAETFDQHDIHIHVPAGAVPKDGPSAGITLCTALASLLRNEPARHDVAMTGEITLTGRVLPVGGIKEKVLAARQAGIHTIVLPEKNRKDVDEIPPELSENLKFVFVKEIGEVLRFAMNGE